MTTTGQDFTIYQGKSSAPVFTVLGANGNAVDISTVQGITWTAARSLTGSAVITKTKAAGGITFPGGGTDGRFTVAITSTDTAALSGYYFHQASLVDQAGNSIEVSTGRLQVAPSPLWTYSGDPSTSARDAVRSNIGDTDPTSPMLMDPEVDALLVANGGVLYTSAAACRTLAARFARKVTKRVGDLSISYSDIAKSYREQAKEFDRLAEQSGASGAIFAGGTSKSDMAARQDSDDRVGAFTTMTQFDNNGQSGGTDPANMDEWPGD